MQLVLFYSNSEEAFIDNAWFKTHLIVSQEQQLFDLIARGGLAGKQIILKRVMARPVNWLPSELMLWLDSQSPELLATVEFVKICVHYRFSDTVGKTDALALDLLIYGTAFEAQMDKKLPGRVKFVPDLPLGLLWAAFRECHMTPRSMIYRDTAITCGAPNETFRLQAPGVPWTYSLTRTDAM